MMQARLEAPSPSPGSALLPLPSASVLMLAAAAVADPGRAARRDTTALRLHRALQLDHLAGSWTRDQLLAALGCLELLDGIARRWAQANRTGRVVELGAPLSTRHLRLGADSFLFTSVDEPSRAAVRAAVFGDMPLHQMVGRPAERAWMRRLAGEDRPLLVLVPELFLDLDEADVAASLASLGDELPSGTEIVSVHGATAVAQRGLDGSVVVVAPEPTRRARTTSCRLAWCGPVPRAPRGRDLTVARLVVA